MRTIHCFNSIRTFCLLLLIFTITSCEERHYPTYYISDEIKPWFDFKSGSYWVYQVDSVNNEDSLYVSNYNDFLHVETADDDIIYKQDKIYIDIENNSNIKITCAIIANAYTIVTNQKIGNTIVYGETDYSTNMDYALVFLYHEGFVLRDNEDLIIEEYDSLLVLNNWYYNVVYKKEIVSTLDNTDLSIQNDTNEIWLARNIGVIKKHINNKYVKHISELKRYNVVQ